MRDDEARTRRPRIGAIAALASEGGEVFAIDEGEGEAELRFKLVLPLPNHSGRSGDENEIDAPPQQHFAKNQTRFDGLAGADVVGNQQVDPRKAQRLPQGEKLVGVLMDAGPERGLEQVSVGGGRGIPAQRAQIGGKDARVVGSELRDAGPAFVLQNCAVEFGVPQDLDHFALSVIVDAGQAKRRQSLTGGALVLHQPTPSSDAHKITALRHCSHSHPPRTVAAWSSPELALIATAPAWPERRTRMIYHGTQGVGDATCGILWRYASGTSPPGV